MFSVEQDDSETRCNSGVPASVTENLLYIRSEYLAYNGNEMNFSKIFTINNVSGKS